MRRDGFTLMELVVTMACAGIVALVAFGVWKGLHGDYVRLQRDYQTSTGALLQDLIQTKNRVVVNPDPATVNKRF
ncbi:MAG: prepilin-type N-terminal cleavage/methylation domain-containing protein [Fibrobacter sp.]|nr:prepilin-type N-terminal cleavage/methylation domain-containing protein [Fibrobacter sp.]